MYLPRFAAGEIRGGVALTEPDCGTDLQAIRTRPSVMAVITLSMARRAGSVTG
ncbi:MAG: hypothetical protein Ct9H300mP13_5920 [Gammaproteobacteria bacterium]|nr:MAG: hypothetical protein Ct9H300mP13_5920 [Gammaproteobacteria bacterium]